MKNYGEMLNRIILILWFLYLFTNLFSQTTANPFIQNFSPLSYNAGDQNWAIIQDHKGLMYFGNNKGILEYDGVSWRLIETEKKSVVRSLAIDDANRIYVGAYGEIGYLAPNKVGKLEYVSLLPHLDSTNHGFADVWKTFSTKHGIFFVTSKYIFRWFNNKMKAWKAPTYFLHGSYVNNELFVKQWETGLTKLVNDSLVAVPDGAKFDLPIIASIVPYSSNTQDQILICTQMEGFYLYDGRSAQRFLTDFEEKLRNIRVYDVVRLSNQNFAISTIMDGILLMDQHGHLITHINKKDGIPANSVWSIFEDNQKNLWAALDIGISRIEIASPISYYDSRNGIEGVIIDIQQCNDKLYLATSTGLYVKNNLASKNQKFVHIKGVPPQCYDLISFGKSILVGTFQGIFEIQNESVRNINLSYTFSMKRSEVDTNRIFVGMQSGLKSLKYVNGYWLDEGLIGFYDKEVREMTETPDGKLWASTKHQGILLVDYSKGRTRAPFFQFGTKQGLPNTEKIIPFNTAKGVRFLSNNGIYKFNEDKQFFSKDNDLIQQLPKKVEFSLVSVDKFQNLWFYSEKNLGSGVAVYNHQTYTWDPTPFLRTSNFTFNQIYPDPVNIHLSWFGGNEKLLVYNSAMPVNTTRDFQLLIRSVTIADDSLIYGGVRTGEGNIQLPNLPFANNSLRITYASMDFDVAKENVYQYYLQGYNNEWSSWRKETWKDFTNLKEGSYQFKVRSKNIYGQISNTAIVEFKITPPFYRSWWAYLIYLGLLYLIFSTFRKFELNKIRQKHQLQLEQAEFKNLKEMDIAKSKFFTDISHELRTPLTLILGPIEKLLKKDHAPEVVKDYKLVQRNAQNLLNMVNQMLDLSRLESSKMQVKLSNSNLIPVIKAAANSLESYAHDKEIDLVVDTSIDVAMVEFNSEKIVQVVTNLVANAIKFTPKTGKITVSIDVDDFSKILHIVVKDNGPGIPADKLPNIFNRFYQIEDTPYFQDHGSGIGLALCKELVEMHHGNITVNSKLGLGTAFSVNLPLSYRNQDAHLIQTNSSNHENTILLVEDNPDMRIFIKEILIQDYQLIEATNGKEGLDAAIKNIPDLILSDVMMPIMDGIELCDAIKHDNRTSHIPLILLSAKSSVASRLDGLERGADDYLGKPFNSDELLLRINNLFEWRERLQKRFFDPILSSTDENSIERSEIEFMSKIRDLIVREMGDINLSIDQIGHTIGMSRSQLFRKMKALTGKAPSIFIRDVRLSEGKNLLENTTMNITEIAYKVGFSSPTYFSDAFKEKYGVRPSQFKSN